MTGKKSKHLCNTYSVKIVYYEELGRVRLYAMDSYYMF